jgi:hypothetical protein
MLQTNSLQITHLSYLYENENVMEIISHFFIQRKRNAKIRKIRAWKNLPENEIVWKNVFTA